MKERTIRRATCADIAVIVPFIDNARRELYPALADSPLPKDLASFSETFIDGPGCFLVAYDDAKSAADRPRLIAGVGFLPYDHRFPHLNHRYRDTITVEVVRLFVHPDYRRHGLAGRMITKLKNEARLAGVGCLYLHTHPFLPGAIGFWERQGFNITTIDPDPVWQTTHMELRL